MYSEKQLQKMPITRLRGLATQEKVVHDRHATKVQLIASLLAHYAKEHAHHARKHPAVPDAVIPEDTIVEVKPDPAAIEIPFGRIPTDVSIQGQYPPIRMPEFMLPERMRALVEETRNQLTQGFEKIHVDCYDEETFQQVLAQVPEARGKAWYN